MYRKWTEGEYVEIRVLPLSLFLSWLSSVLLRSLRHWEIIFNLFKSLTVLSVFSGEMFPWTLLIIIHISNGEPKYF